MAVIAVLLGFLAFTQMDAVKEFGKHSNGVREYSFVEPVACDGGLHETGYSIAMGNRVVLKQHNKDGSVGKVCVK